MVSGNYKSVFDIIGPVMVGPSSSHTDGAVAIGQAAHKIFGEPIEQVIVDYYESFAKTHQGHGTDYAVIAGVLGMQADDLCVPEAVDIARAQGIEVVFNEHEEKSPIGHPNTAIITLKNADKMIKVGGCSIGGGTIEIRELELDGCRFAPLGPLPIMLCWAETDFTARIKESLNQDNIKIRHEMTNIFGEGNLIHEFDLDRLPPKNILEQIKAHSRSLVCL